MPLFSRRENDMDNTFTGGRVKIANTIIEKSCGSGHGSNGVAELYPAMTCIL